jgi:hypothetical protein
MHLGGDAVKRRRALGAESKREAGRRAFVVRCHGSRHGGRRGSQRATEGPRTVEEAAVWTAKACGPDSR